MKNVFCLFSFLILSLVATSVTAQETSSAQRKETSSQEKQKPQQAEKEPGQKQETLKELDPAFIKKISDSMRRREVGLEGDVQLTPSQDGARSASHRFLRIFDKSHARVISDLRVSKKIANGTFISVNIPLGWVQQETTNPNIVILLTEGGRKENRIEVRRGENIAPSQLGYYLDSFRSSIERAGFEPVFEPLEEDADGANQAASTRPPSTQQGGEISDKRIIGGLKGKYIKFRPSTEPGRIKLKGKKNVGLILFLYESPRFAWIFLCYSTVGDIDQIAPLFEQVVQSAQFDSNQNAPSDPQRVVSGTDGATPPGAPPSNENKTTKRNK